MTYTLQIEASARTDAQEIIVWYKAIQEKLAIDFLFNVDRTLEKILHNPFAYPIVHGEFRRALLKRFPYGVHYRIRGEVVIVAAIFHTSRSPSIWQTRH